MPQLACVWSTDPDAYVAIFENDWVRVLNYRDHPGQVTTPHRHPNSVMITLSDFQRQLSSNGNAAQVSMTAGRAVWLPAQTHSGRAQRVASRSDHPGQRGRPVLLPLTER